MEKLSIYFHHTVSGHLVGIPLAMARPVGIPMSESAKAKIRAFQLGRKRSPETRRKIAQAARQRDLSQTIHSPEARAKAAERLRGRVPWQSRQPTTPAFCQARRLVNLGRRRSPEFCQQVGERHRGARSHWWKGGVARLHQQERQQMMQTGEYRQWRRAVLARDGKRCQQPDEDCRGPLHVHHLLDWARYPALRFTVANGMTLCAYHHRRQHAKVP